jgi:hypothetical protein
MAKIIISSFFVPLDTLPQIDDTTAIVKILDQLSERRVGGFISKSDGIPQHYYRGDHLAEILFATMTAIPAVTNLQLKSFPPLLPLLHPFAGVPVSNQSVKVDENDNTLLEEDNISIHKVVDHESNQVGWFFPSEVLRYSIYTPSPVWTCDRCKQKTRFGDNGRHWCGGRLH